MDKFSEHFSEISIATSRTSLRTFILGKDHSDEDLRDLEWEGRIESGGQAGDDAKAVVRNEVRRADSSSTHPRWPDEKILKLHRYMNNSISRAITLETSLILKITQYIDDHFLDSVSRGWLHAIVSWAQYDEVRPLIVAQVSVIIRKLTAKRVSCARAAGWALAHLVKYHDCYQAMINNGIVNTVRNKIITGKCQGVLEVLPKLLFKDIEPWIPAIHKVRESLAAAPQTNKGRNLAYAAVRFLKVVANFNHGIMCEGDKCMVVILDTVDVGKDRGHFSEHISRHDETNRPRSDVGIASAWKCAHAQRT